MCKKKKKIYVSDNVKINWLKFREQDASRGAGKTRRVNNVLCLEM
jgi:hypothetical protein